MSKTGSVPTVCKSKSPSMAELNMKLQIMQTENRKLEKQLLHYQKSYSVEKAKRQLSDSENHKLKVRVSHFQHNNVKLKEKLDKLLTVAEKSEKKLCTQLVICEHLTDIIKRI